MKIRKVGYYSTLNGPNPESGGIHAYYEILVIHQGRAVLEWLGQSYSVEGPVVFLLSPNTPHRLQCLSSPLRYLYVEFEIDDGDATLLPTLQQLFQWNALQGKLLWPPLESTLISLSLQSLEPLAILYATDKTPLMEEALGFDLRKMFTLVRHLLQHKDRMEGRIETVQQTQIRIIEAIMRYMESNYREALTLQTLAQLVHLNGSYLIRLFKALQGKTPFQYLNELRMSAATSYLQNSDLSIQEISKASGYSSIHYFSRAFKQKFGVSPSVTR